jgi:hypothetical protein
VTNLLRSDSFQPRRTRTPLPSLPLQDPLSPIPPGLPSCSETQGNHIADIVMIVQQNQPPHIVTHIMKTKQNALRAYPSIAPRSGEASRLHRNRRQSARVACVARTCGDGEGPGGAGGAGRGACGRTIHASDSQQHGSAALVRPSSASQRSR